MDKGWGSLGDLRETNSSGGNLRPAEIEVEQGLGVGGVEGDVLGQKNEGPFGYL